MLILYSLGLAAIFLVTAPVWLTRMLLTGRYRAGFSERLGRVPLSLQKPAAPILWLHANSVGEVLAATPLLAQLQIERPHHRIVVSTATSTGRALAEKRVGPANVFCLPFDLPFLIQPFLRSLQPGLILIMESEIWPNFIHQCRLHNIPVALINARIAGNSRRRSRRLRPLWRPAFGGVTLFLAQSEQDAARIREIGGHPGRIHITGNLKFDVPPPPGTPLVAALSTHLPPGSALIVCGSTLDGEEAILLNAWQKIAPHFPAALLLLAPRIPNRFDAVARLAATHHPGRPLIRLSRWQLNPTPIAPASILLLDTIGDLASLYRLARVAFIGGSLVPAGGHNPLEPAQFAVPILMGPSYENFHDIVLQLRTAGGIRNIAANELPAALTEWLASPTLAAAIGAQARSIIAAQSGATQRTLQALLPLVPHMPVDSISQQV